MDELPQWSAASGAGVGDVFLGCVVVGGAFKVKEVGNSGTDSAEVFAELWERLISGRVSYLILTKGSCSSGQLVPDFGCCSEHGVCDMSHFNDGSKCDKLTQFTIQPTWVFSQGAEHLGCALGVSDVCDFGFTCLFSHEIYLGWGIVLSELIEAIAEKVFRVTRWWDMAVFPTILSSSVVSQPYIKASIDYLKSWRIFASDCPEFSAWKEPMLQKDHWRPLSYASFWSHVHHCELVTVWSGYLMGFVFVSVPLAELGEGWVAVGVGAGFRSAKTVIT